MNQPPPEPPPGATDDTHAIIGQYNNGQMEAYKEGVKDGKWIANSSRASSPNAPRIRIPRLAPHTVGAYIGAVARAARNGAITPTQANTMLYAAQLMVSAHRHPTPVLLDGAPRNLRSKK